MSKENIDLSNYLIEMEKICTQLMDIVVDNADKAIYAAEKLNAIITYRKMTTFTKNEGGLAENIQFLANKAENICKLVEQISNFTNAATAISLSAAKDIKNISQIINNQI